MNADKKTRAPRTTCHAHIKSILVISLSWIGDVLLTTPVLGVLKDNFPPAKITVLAGKIAYPLLERHVLVDRVLIFDNHGVHRGWRGIARLIGELRRDRYDMVVDLRNTLIPYFLRTRRRITAHRTHMRHRNVRGRHAIDRHLDVLADHGIPITRREMILSVPEDVSAKIDIMLKDIKWLNGNEIIAVLPGARNKYKEYPPEQFSAVVNALAEHGDRKFAMLGGESDIQAAAQIVEAAPEVIVTLLNPYNMFVYVTGDTG